MRAFRIVFVIAFVLALLVGVISPATAQTTVSGSIVDTTTPISQELRETLNAWLSVSAPAPYPFWVVTYTQVSGTDTFVSLAALDDWEPDRARWSLEDGAAVWSGTVVVHSDGSVQMYQPTGGAALRNVPKLAMPIMPAGGDSTVRFPWSRGKSMYYGTRGVHGEGDYGTTGMVAVDWMGGDDLGSGVASDVVYASTSGTVDYVCTDGQSVAVRLQNGDDYYLYAHLQDNSNLELGHVFAARSNMGSLVHGSFSGACGWADQTDNHYHLHWMFSPDNAGTFQVSGCILDITQQTWTCGRDTRGPGEYIADDGTGTGGDGGGGGGGDNPSTSNEDVSFFDFVLVGFIELWQTLVIDQLPPHETFEYTAILLSTVKLTLRIARVLVYGNINLGHLMTVIVVGLAIKLIFGLAWLVAFLFKAWKSLVPIIGA